MLGMDFFVEGVVGEARVKPHRLETSPDFGPESDRVRFAFAIWAVSQNRAVF